MCKERKFVFACLLLLLPNTVLGKKQNSCMAEEDEGFIVKYMHLQSLKLGEPCKGALEDTRLKILKAARGAQLKDLSAWQILTTARYFEPDYRSIVAAAEGSAYCDFRQNLVCGSRENKCTCVEPAVLEGDHCVLPEGAGCWNLRKMVKYRTPQCAAETTCKIDESGLPCTGGWAVARVAETMLFDIFLRYIENAKGPSHLAEDLEKEMELCKCLK